MTTKTSKIPTWKSDEVKSVKKDVSSFKVVAAVNIAGLPSRQFQEIRKSLRGQVKLRVSRLNLVRRAFKSSPQKDLLLQLLKQTDGPTALAFTNENPYKLYKSLESTKQPAPAKEGASSPIDIKVRKGETNFKPGPIVGDLQRVGVPAVIEGGKVIIREDRVIVHKGDVFSREMVEMLSRLEIMPLTVGLNLCAVFADEMIFMPGDLYIDEDKFKSQIAQAASQTLNLAVHTAYPAADTIKVLIAKAARETRLVALEAAVPATEIIKELIASADAKARGVKAIIPS